jgi:hypothetical protein
MNEDLINKLPSHAKKEFLKYALKLSEKQNKTKINNDFLTFVKQKWAVTFDFCLYNDPTKW